MSASPEKANQVSSLPPDPCLAEINRVLIGAGARPPNPVAAFTIFRGAVAAGSAAAAERLAALAAHGINRQANWNEAIGSLVKAADMGHAPAQDRIKVLARGRSGTC